MGQGTTLSGRQLMWLIMDHRRTSPEMIQQFDVVDIAKVQWMGDDQMHKFRKTWESIARVVKRSINITTLQRLLYDQMKKSTILQHDIAAYERMK